VEKKTLVLDASVIVKWYNNEDDTDKALAIRDLYRKHLINIVEPQLLLYEVANAIRFNKTLALPEKTEIIENLFHVDFTTVPPSPSLMTEACNLAHKLNVTVYDTTYIALAREINALYVSADEELIGKAKSNDIIMLSDWKD
jgi:predicted nucleic acid-binding protein